MIRLTVETGILTGNCSLSSHAWTEVLMISVQLSTAAIAILTLILTFLPGRPIYYQASISFLGKVYSNSVMVAFNSRMKIGSSNSNSTAHEVAMPLSQSSRTRGEIPVGSETQVRGMTREDISFSVGPNVRDIFTSSNVIHWCRQLSGKGLQLEALISRLNRFSPLRVTVRGMIDEVKMGVARLPNIY